MYAGSDAGASTASRLYSTVRVMRKTRKLMMLSIWKGPCTWRVEAGQQHVT
jgi:hypothetical protein